MHPSDIFQEQRIPLDADSCMSNVRGLYYVEFYDDAKYTNYCSGSIH